MVRDPKFSLQALIRQVETIIIPAQQAAIKQRIENISVAKAAKIKAEFELDKKDKNTNALRMSQFASLLAKNIPADTIIFDEGLTSSPAVTRYMPPTKPGHYFVTRGGSLGVGFPGAIGAKLFNPEHTVIGFSGDGGSMYTIQALWTAVRHNVGAKFVVCNNGSYKLLQLNIDEYWKGHKVEGRKHPTSFDLALPAIRFDLIAQAMGVDAVRVESEEEIMPAIERMMADDKPFLIDLVMQDHT